MSFQESSAGCPTIENDTPKTASAFKVSGESTNTGAARRILCVAIDFESYYDKDLSVVTMGAWHYARQTDIYLVSMCFNDGTCFVGHPKDAPWERCHNIDWVMHNAAFDLTLFRALVERGVVPAVEPFAVYDTADLAAFLGYPRSLKEAAKHLLGVEMSKTTRDNMKGVIWNPDADLK